MELTQPDIFLIILYLAVLVFIGIWAARSQTPDKFLISQRKVGTLAGLSTINATKTGAILVSFTALVCLHGFSAFWVFIGGGLGFLLFIPFAQRLYRKSNQKYYTLSDYFHYNYAQSSGRLASIISTLATLAFLTTNLIASAKIMELLTSFSFNLSVVIIAGIILVYLWLAGFNAVVKTDVFQYLAILGILVFFTILLFSGVTVPADQWNLTAVGPQQIVSFLLLGFLCPFAMPDLWQRVYAFRGVRQLKKGIFYSTVTYVLFGFILTLAAFGIKAKMPGADPDTAFIQGLAGLLPVGLGGLAVVLLFAALMSSIDTYAYTASSLVIQDFFRGLSREATVKKIRRTIIIVMLFAVGFSILIRDVIDGTFISLSSFSVLSVAALATWIKPSVKALTLNLVFIFGAVAVTVFIALAFSRGQALKVDLILKGLAGSLTGLFVALLYRLAGNAIRRIFARNP